MTCPVKAEIFLVTSTAMLHIGALLKWYLKKFEKESNKLFYYIQNNF